MSYLLEIAGRGLLTNLATAFQARLSDTGLESTDQLRRCAQSHPTNSQLQARLGSRYLMRQDMILAAEAFSRALEHDEDLVSARLGIACALDHLGRSEETIGHLQLAQQAEPADASILFALGFCHERAGRDRLAERIYHRCLAISPHLRNAHERLAAVYLHRNQIERCIDHYVLLCKSEPEQIAHQLKLANLYLQNGQADLAVEWYEHALTIDPDNWTAHNDSALAYEQVGLYREAIERLESHAGARPEFADTYVRLGDLYVKIGQSQTALSRYLQAIELHPDYLEASVKIGRHYLRAGQYRNAARWFNQAIEINDRLVMAYAGLCVAQRHAGKVSDSLTSLAMAQTIEPNSTLLFCEAVRLQIKDHARDPGPVSSDGSAWSASQTGDKTRHIIDRQISAHRRALARRPNHAILHYRLGVLLRSRGQLEAAIGSLTLAARINPGYVKAILKLGLSFKEACRAEEAAETLNRAFEYDADLVAQHYQLGLLFSQPERFELTLEQFAAVLSADPHSLDIRASLALALDNVGLLDRAEASWQTQAELVGADQPAQAAETA